MNKAAIQGQTYDTLRSTLTPGTSRGVVIKAQVDTASTRVAVTPPWRAPPAFWCSSNTVISQVHLPSPPPTTRTLGI